jgi:hypothetical protein
VQVAGGLGQRSRRLVRRQCLVMTSKFGERLGAPEFRLCTHALICHCAGQFDGALGGHELCGVLTGAKKEPG